MLKPGFIESLFYWFINHTYLFIKKDLYELKTVPEPKCNTQT